MKRLIFLLALLLTPRSSVAQTDEDGPAAAKDSEPQPVKVYDGFDEGPTLKWELRDPDPQHYSYEKRPGTLTITTQKGGLYRASNNCKNLFVLPNPLQGGKDFEITTCLVDFEPTARWHQGGMVCLDDEDNYLKLVCEYNGGPPKRKLTVIRETRGSVAPHTYYTSVPEVERLWLRLTKRGNRYAYSSSADGESFRAHGELSWGDGAPKYVGLIAKNSNNDEITKVDASFDFFELRERLPGERPVFLYTMPSSGDVVDLLGFINDLRKFQPDNPEDAALHNRRAPSLLKIAAQRILQTEQDRKSEAYQTALLVLLEDRARILADAVPAQQQQTVDLVKLYLTARVEEVGRALEAQDLALTLSVGDALERAGNLKLATEAYTAFADLIAKGDDRTHTESLKMLQGAARRLGLTGKAFEPAVADALGTQIDWAEYRGKTVVVLFVSAQSDASLDELRRAGMMQALYRDRGLDVLCICVDRDRRPAKKLLEEEQFPWTIVLAPEPDTSHPLVTHLGVTTAPTMMMLDKQGKVVSPRIQSDELTKWLEESLGPPYDPKGELSFVDLPSKANLKLADKLGNIANNDLSELPRGEQTFAGVPFAIRDAVIQLAGQNLTERPEKIEGIPINTTFGKLYFLHGTAWKENDGAVIGQYRVNYEGGAVETVPIVYGQDVRNWHINPDPRPTGRSTIAWTGQNAYTRRFNASVRLYLGVWENPRPAERVVSIDYVSSNTLAAPFCVAMTAEQP
jgi:hypothetical protein